MQWAQGYTLEGLLPAGMQTLCVYPGDGGDNVSAPLRNDLGQSAVAPLWHTCCVLAMLAMFAGLSVYLRTGSSHPRVGHLLLYSIAIAFEWAVFAVSLWNSDAAFGRYVGRVFHNPRSLWLDILVALLLCGVVVLVEPIMMRVLGRTGWVSLEGMRPNNRLQIAAWIVMAISAGISEETVFRGYLQQQFAAWTGHVSIGILGQAALFGLVHEYEGWKYMTLIFVLGGILGVSARLRKGLRANMIAHSAMDILSAF
jgi:uncharacterized protein